MKDTKTVLVTGATGRQGGAVVQHLLQNNFKVRALTRTPESLAARHLVSMGVTVAKGDMSDITSLVNTMKDCDGVFSIQNYFEYGAEKEVLYGKNVTAAAVKAGITHFIYSSVCNAGAQTGVPHFDTKLEIEQYIKSTGLPATIVRPVKFMENYYIPQVFKGILDGKLFDAIRGGKKHQMIAVDDIGKYVVAVFADPSRFIGKTIEIAGDELTNEEIAATMSEVLGRQVKFKRPPLWIVKLFMDNEMYRMFRWFDDKGFTADMEKTKGDFPDIRSTTLREFLIKENWQRWNKKGSV